MIHVWQITLFLSWITATNDLIQSFVFEVLASNVGRTLFHQKNEIKHFQVFHSSDRNYFTVKWGFFFLSFCNLQRDFIEIINCIISSSQLKNVSLNSKLFFFRQGEILNEDILCILNIWYYLYYISSIIDLFLNWF